MTINDAIEVLRKHNEWRRYSGEIDKSPEMTDPATLGKAIDTVVEHFADESEDERMVRCIEVALTDVDEQRFKDFGTTLKECLAYLEKQKEQKPSINIEHLKSYMLQYLQDAANRKDDSEIEADTDKWAKKIIELMGIVEQKPAEWSEEDAKKLNHIREIVHISSGSDVSIDEKEELESFLESLRPSWKPSEQEKGALRTAIFVLTEERNFPKAAAQLQNILDAFEGEESRKDWKPTEEQMAVLLNAEGLVRANNYPENAKILASLYKQLKKL